MKRIVIAGYARSPFTLAKKGALTRVRPDDLVADVVRALVQRTGVDPAEIEDLILGCAFPEGEQGLNMARLVALQADLPKVTAPTLVFRSVDDHVVPRLSVETLVAGATSATIDVRELVDSFHVATLDNDAQRIFDESLDFVRAHSQAGV